MRDIKCSPEAREKCPFDHPCDSEEKAYFEEGSPCDEFNKALIPSPPPTNADHIRAMSDEELADLLCTADWCETCDQMREEGTCKAMELDGPLSKHCVSAALRWLRQPYKEAPNDPT